MLGFLFKLVHKRLCSFIVRKSEDWVEYIKNENKDINVNRVLLIPVGNLQEVEFFQRAPLKHGFETYAKKVVIQRLFYVVFYVVFVENDGTYKLKKNVIFEDYEGFLKEHGIHISQWGFLRRIKEVFDAIHLLVTL